MNRSPSLPPGLTAEQVMESVQVADPHRILDCSSITDVRGARVALLVDGRIETGARAVLWDGRDAGRARVPSGGYLARLRAGSAAETAKITLVRC